MKLFFEDGTILNHKDALLKVFKADGVTPAPKNTPMFGQEYVFVLGPVRLTKFDTRPDTTNNSKPM